MMFYKCAEKLKLKWKDNVILHLYHLKWGLACCWNEFLLTKPVPNCLLALQSLNTEHHSKVLLWPRALLLTAHWMGEKYLYLVWCWGVCLIKMKNNCKVTPSFITEMQNSEVLTLLRSWNSSYTVKLSVRENISQYTHRGQDLHGGLREWAASPC